MPILSRLSLAAGFCLAALLAASGSQASAADAPATKKIKAGDLDLTVPETWEKQPVHSQFRKAQMKVPDVPGDKDETDFVVYYFEGGGGGVDANVERWIGSFLPTGRKVKVTSGKSPQGEYVFVDLSGSWKKPVGPMIRQQTQESPNSRALSVVLITKEGPYFLRLTGPEKTVTANVDAFRAAFGADAKTEKERPVAKE